MTFPKINHILDVLPHVIGRKDFVVVKKDCYTVIDYVFTDKDTFDHPIRRECRGLKFGPDDALLSRPLHKFANYGEWPETTNIDWTLPHRIYDKLDGSMIHPAIVNHKLVFMTRMGVTEVAEQAFRYATTQDNINYIGFAVQCLREGFTPIFEWTSPNNRIVVPYKEEALTLLALRNNFSGEYQNIHNNATVRQYGIPTVKQWKTDFGSPQCVDDFIGQVRDLKDEEGVVVQFENGLFVKIKADEYVKFHRAKDSLATEKRVLTLVLEGKTDDLMPLLSPADQVELADYSHTVWSFVVEEAKNLSQFVLLGYFQTKSDRKTFATEWVPDLRHPCLRAAAFKMWTDGIDEPHEVLANMLLLQCHSNEKIEGIRDLIGGAKWRSCA